MATDSFTSKIKYRIYIIWGPYYGWYNIRLATILWPNHISLMFQPNVKYSNGSQMITDSAFVNKTLSVVYLELDEDLDADRFLLNRNFKP